MTRRLFVIVVLIIGSLATACSDSASLPTSPTETPPVTNPQPPIFIPPSGDVSDACLDLPGNGVPIRFKDPTTGANTPLLVQFEVLMPTCGVKISLTPGACLAMSANCFQPKYKFWSEKTEYKSSKWSVKGYFGANKGEQTWISPSNGSTGSSGNIDLTLAGTGFTNSFPVQAGSHCCAWFTLVAETNQVLMDGTSEKVVGVLPLYRAYDN